MPSSSKKEENILTENICFVCSNDISIDGDGDVFIYQLVGAPNGRWKGYTYAKNMNACWSCWKKMGKNIYVKAYEDSPHKRNLLKNYVTSKK